MSERIPGLEGTLLEAKAAETPRTSSSPASADDEHAQQHKLILQNFDLLFKKIEQLANVVQGTVDALESTRKEMVTTMELEQGMIGREDEQIERLELVAAALVQMQAATQAGNRPPPSQ